MLKVGVIGAGAISNMHLSGYAKNPEVEIVAIADRNESTARGQAEKYGIKRYDTDYRRILEDDSVDAVSIVTPTFTHHDIVMDALRANKHVLCEKPPCITEKDVTECVREAEKREKLLMWGFPVRFHPGIRFLKEYIDAGMMGKIYYAEVARMIRCSKMEGWFVDKEKAGGGALMDGAIHELDTALYLMGYPKVKSVTGFYTHINNDLPEKIKGISVGWASSDKRVCERTVESMASGYVLFENDVCLYVKASYAMHSVTEGRRLEITGDKAGAGYDGKAVSLVTTSNGYLVEQKPIITEEGQVFEEEIKHFVSCCLRKERCICEAWQGIEVIRIIESIYKSAQTGTPIFFE